INIGKEKKKFCPTELGLKVNSIMMKHFPNIIDYEFTSNMEKKLDAIAAGKKDWVTCLQEFWDQLQPLLQELGSAAGPDGQNRFQRPCRVFGCHPKTKKEICAEVGKFGPMISMNSQTTEGKKIYASIKEPLTVDTITLKDALKILEYPKILGF